MNIIDYRVIPHTEQRYLTVGDWQADEDGRYIVRVSDLGDWRKSLAIGLHEIIEAALCKAHGISGNAVDAFDLSYAGAFEDTGDDPAAPYHREHEFAKLVERMLVRELGMEWDTEHEAAVGALPEWRAR